MTAKKSAAKKAAPKKDPKDPRGSAAPATGTTVETHTHLAAEGTRRRLAGLDDAAPSKPKGDPIVTVRIPKPFRLQVLEDHGSRVVHYDSGINEMPESHARHDYSVANGVEIVDE